MIRLHMVVEGQTEEEFANSLLSVHLGFSNVSTDVRSVETSRSRARARIGREGRIYKGGLRNYARAKKDLVLWMKEDQNNDAYFTTMFDLYALPPDFPAFDDAKGKIDPYARIGKLERHSLWMWTTEDLFPIFSCMSLRPSSSLIP